MDIIAKGVLMKRILTAFFAVVILAVALYLVIRIPKPGLSENHKTEAPVTASTSTEEWLGMYIHDQRVGYSFTKIIKNDNGLVVENRSQMTIFMMQEVRTLSTYFFAHTNADYTLKDFSLEIFTTGHPTKIEGKIEDKTMILTSYSQGIPQTKSIVLEDRPFFPDALEEIIKDKNLKPGDELTIPYFDPTTQSQSPAKIRILDAEPVQVLNRQVTGTKVQVDFMGIATFLWLDENYRLLKESSPNLGLEMIPLSKEDALAEIKPDQAFDLLSYFSVKLDKPIPGFQKLSYIKLELDSIEIGELELNGDYQVLVSRAPIIIEAYYPDLDSLPDLMTPIHDQKDFLRSSVYIQSDHPDIIAEAKRIVGHEKNAKKMAEQLVNGVNTMLEKRPTPSLPSALDVLKTREGDCNEHAILFTALARALGIPCKIYVGLVNLYGNAYYYHAWCAVWLGKWVAVDPTFGQFPADLYHLKLKEGEISEQAKVLTVVGKLKITVLEYR